MSLTIPLLCGSRTDRWLRAAIVHPDFDPSELVSVQINELSLSGYLRGPWVPDESPTTSVWWVS
jgi:hypothetical protein